jgi:phosphoglycerate kinase
MFHKKTLHDYDVAGKTVLLRADFNVPVVNGEITSAFRITQTVPTIQALLEKNCKVVIISHLGRPKGKDDASCSLKPVAKVLSKVLGRPVTFVSDCIGEAVSEATKAMQPCDVVLLENVRYYDEEEKNDASFASSLARDTHADVFVQDGFGVVHRAHASTDAITKILPAVAGLLLTKEVVAITTVMSNPDRPLMAIIGGAKIADKIDIIYKFIELADIVVIGGAMANTFHKARGVAVGKSLVDESELDTARDVLEVACKEAKKRKFVFYLPQDGVVAREISSKTTTRIVDWDAHVIADIESYPAKPRARASQVGANEKILDIGPFSGAFIAGAMQLAETVVWNGTMGVSEVPAVHGPIGPFAHGSELVIDGLLGQYGHKPFSLIGGGDTASYIEQRKLTDMLNHVSTGGGASLELMSGKDLPGISALLNKDH